MSPDNKGGVSKDTNKKLISETEARREAEQVLAFEIGNIPHLGDAKETETEYVFPIVTTLPRVIFDEDRESPVDVKFMSSEKVGEIRIDGNSGDLKDRSHIYEIERKIRSQEQEIKKTVEKALVRSSAGRFSKLPFPEHRYTPITDLLSHLILQGPVRPEDLDAMNAADKQKYHDYVEMLEQVNLVRTRGDEIVADNIFIEIQAQKDTHTEMLDGALAHFFRQGADHIETIREILGPYLILSGYYYQRALEVEDGHPSITEAEFREQISQNYAGNNRAQKQFKLPRYMIQLEEVEILKCDEDRDGAWKGRSEVKEDLLRQDDLLSPISDVMA
ncbi:hypothetical protein [Natrinema ejinorense]|uniref:hypothetical protein n=1 Tax=Natrinema ejinorense TaxID=373386 RepID=UPI0011805C3C|nr:hypothetical protein [Natrinema ejinorense]